MHQRIALSNALKGQKLIGGCAISHIQYALKGQKLSSTNQYTKLLPLQGALLTANIPRALPWARSFWAFSPFLSHKRKFCDGVSPDLQSGVKKCPNLFRLCGFAIRSKEVCFFFCWGITNPPVLIGRTFFYGGLQIHRDA